MATKINKSFFDALKHKASNFTFADLVLVGMGAVLLIFFAYFFSRTPTTSTITIKINEENVAFFPRNESRSWFSQMFYKGMKEKDGLGKTTAEVISIRSYDTAPARKAVYLTIKLNTVYNRASNQYTYRGKPMLVGSTLKLYLDSLLVEGLVTAVEGIKDPRQKVILLVESQIRDETPVHPETSGTKPYVATALTEGQELKDDQGNIIITILNKRVEDAKKVVTTNDGRVLVQTNPLRKDVYLTLRVKANQIANRYYIFDDVPILIGIGIPMNTSTISVWPEVTKIQLEEN